MGQVNQAVRRLATDWTARVRSPVSEWWRFFFTPSYPDWSWGPLSLLQNEHRWLSWCFGIFGSLIWSKTLMKLIFNHYTVCEFRRSPECPVSQIHTPHIHVGAPGILSDLLRSVQMLKREWGAESNGKLPHLLNP